MIAPYRGTLTLDGHTDRFEAETLDGALAVAKAFEDTFAGNPEAYSQIWEGEKLVHNRWLGERAGPRDTRHPLASLYAKAIRLGRPTMIAEFGRPTQFFNGRGK